MELIPAQKQIITFVMALIVFFVVNATIAAAAPDATGYAGAWYGNSATNTSDYTASDGTFGVIKNPSGTIMTNKPTGPPTGFYNVTDNKDTTVTFVISPTRSGTTKYKISFIKYKNASATNWTTVSSNNYTSTGDVQLDLKLINKSGNSTTGYTFYIWAGFEEDIVKYTLTGSIDNSNHSAIETCDTDPATSITPTSPLTTYTTSPPSITVTSTSGNPTPTVVFTLNTASTCEVASVKYDTGGSTFAGLSGTEPYQSGTTYTKALNKTATFTVLFRKQTVLITATVDSTSPAACTSGGSKLSQPTGYFVKGTSPDFVISVNPGCAIESVIVSDTGPDPDYVNKDVTTTVIANLNKYTFSNVQSAGSITVKFVSVVTADKVYCQLPPFLKSEGSLKPNVLILFDTSGSMGDNPMGGIGTYNCKDTHTAADLGNTGCREFKGYFDTAKMYSKSGSTYSIAPITSGAPLNLKDSGTSGNYLNYDLMSKVDVIRKILIGGKVATPSGSVGVLRGVTGTKYLSLYNGGSPLYVEYGPDDPTGVLQSVFESVRLGLMVFSDDNTTGKVSAPLGSSLETLITQIQNDTNPGGSTPLAGSLYEAVRYFRGDTSTKTGVNYSDTTNFPVDPLFTRHALEAPCQKNFVIVITDGQPNESTTLPVGSSGDALYDSYASWWADSSLTVKPPTGSSNNMARVAYYAHTHDLTKDTGTRSNDLGQLQNNLNIFTVYTFDKSNTGEPALQQTAKFGSFDEDTKNTWNKTNHNGMPDVNEEWSTSSGTLFNNYFKSMDPTALEASLNQVFSKIGSISASGTAAAVANNKSGERGANMIQALFFPQWPNDSSVKWLGEVQALWYYLDPIIGSSSMYEDTDLNKELNLMIDKIPSTEPFAIKSLWRAGAKLQLMAADDRTIYTNLDNSTTPALFSIANNTSIKPLMSMQLESDTVSNEMINYIRGTDVQGKYRSRYVEFLNPVTNADSKGTWKLGDIINSTPQVQSSISLNTYQNTYFDMTYDTFVKTNAYKARNIVLSGSNDGMLHAFRLGNVNKISDSTNALRLARITDGGDNSTLGKEEWAFIPKNALPYLKNQSGVDYCHQYLLDGSPLVVDASINCNSSPYWGCEKVSSSWKTVVIGSMGLGGASRDKGTVTSPGSCNETYSPDSILTNNKDCVKTPITGTGLSSYFALDVTDPLAPKFMWEFSDYNISDVSNKGLGFTTPGPAIVRINTPTITVSGLTKKTTGRWFAVFASGPTGELDASNKWFSGHSDQELKLYIVDIGGGSSFTECTTVGQTGCNYWVKPTGKKFAFANSLAGAAIDLDNWSPAKEGFYSDSVVYVTYTKAALTTVSGVEYPASSNAWNKGGVVRLVTNHDPDPYNWQVSTLIDDVGPITTSVARAQDRSRNKLWVYFGEGRHFYPGDDIDATRQFYGVLDPCFTNYKDATNNGGINSTNYPMYTTSSKCVAVDKSKIGDVTGHTASDTLDPLYTAGWKSDMKIKATTGSGTVGAERVLSDVGISQNGIVTFTTYIPNTDVCVPGGKTSMYRKVYNTGSGPALTGSGSAPSIIPLQTSSGSVQLINSSIAFNADGSLKDGYQPLGMASKNTTPSLQNAPASKKIMHIQER